MRARSPHTDAPASNRRVASDTRERATLARLLTGQIGPSVPTPRQWAGMLAQARAQQLAGRLAHVVLEHPDAAGLEPRLLAQLASARRIADAHQHSMRWELNRLAHVFRQTGDRPVLLKGAAYCARGLEVARGRHYGDVDLLVEEARLPAIETALRFAGYAPEKTSAYDQHYYRTWMHEIPPMRHLKRGTSLDVHFRLIPRTSRIPVDHAPLLAHRLPVNGPFDVLAPEAMLLHSMVHLYTESEFPQGLRNLFDIHLLIIEFTQENNLFKERLEVLARSAGLGRVLADTLHWRALFFESGYPDAERTRSIGDTRGPTSISRPESKSESGFGPGSDSGLALRSGPGSRLVAALIQHGLNPDAAQRQSAIRRCALGLLYLRGHWLRMPTGLLARHLWHQFLSRRRDKDQ